MAKALALPQYQPKVTPSKKGIQDKADRKHKGRKDYMESVIEESVMGMTQMDSMLPRLLTLAGLPVEDEATIVPQEFDEPVTISSDYDEVQMDCEAPMDVEVEELPPTVSESGSGTMQVIRDSFKSISGNLSEIKVSEFAEVRTMLADLMSQIDRMGNSITGK
jgi:hypothetical protein